MSEREIELKIIEQAENLAKLLSRGKEIEIRTSKDGIAIYAEKKERIA